MAPANDTILTNAYDMVRAQLTYICICTLYDIIMQLSGVLKTD